MEERTGNETEEEKRVKGKGKKKNEKKTTIEMPG
jgi:hypothetical protein